jgi:hypothetical protein
MNDGGSSLIVDNFTSNVAPGGQLSRESDGKAEIVVGATLYINGGVASQFGYYNGSYEIVFTYN